MSDVYIYDHVSVVIIGHLELECHNHHTYIDQLSVVLLKVRCANANVCVRKCHGIGSN